jgi:FAD/FMN-containing dehydrogenase
MPYESWGRFPKLAQQGVVPRFRDEIAPLAPTLPYASLTFGNGRSYGDACLAAGGTLLDMRELNRLIAFDPASGIVRCEAGMLLADLIRRTLPYGWFPPVTPGTQLVTLGGAIANDVHGKNHHSMGSFGDHVLRFELLRSDGQRLICTVDENADWFTATIGGLGLTGVISWVELQLRRVGGPWLATESIRFDNLDEFFALNDTSADWEYTVAWIDCVATGKALGRGHFLRANHLNSTSDQALPQARPRSMPLTPPVSLVNQLSLRAFNTLYYHRQRARSVSGLSHYRPYFYPLDSIAHWNRMYGPRGFQQYQCVLPPEVAHDATAEMLACITRSGQGSFLAVLKTFGNRRGRGLLSFARPGVTLALDFAERGEQTAMLFDALDQAVMEAKGAIYPAKDAHMPAALFQAAYPEWEALEARRDPRLCSAFWRRVTERTQ